MPQGSTAPNVGFPSRQRLKPSGSKFTDSTAFAPSSEALFFLACLPILKYGNISWDLSGWFPNTASRCACGSMRKVLRKHDARGSSCGSSWRPYVRLETLFVEASRKHLPRNHCGRVCGSEMFLTANQEEISLRGSSAEARGRKGCYFQRNQEGGKSTAQGYKWHPWGKQESRP